MPNTTIFARKFLGEYMHKDVASGLAILFLCLGLATCVGVDRHYDLERIKVEKQCQ